MPDALTAINLRHTPQSQQADPRQVQNSAGGYTFTVADDARLQRFLTLGTEGGTYYASERKITQDNAGIVLDWARNRSTELVQRIVAVSVAGRAPRNNPAIFALAAAASLGDADGRKAALDALPQVARTGTHLFLFAGYIEQFRGWGRGLRRAVGEWYTGQPLEKIAYQAVKYRQREGWTHRDLLRLSHPKADSNECHELFDWMCGRDADLAGLPIVRAFEKAQKATTVEKWTKQIRKGVGLSWEMLPDAALTEPDVWRALIEQGMPQTALMRQLPRLTRLGVLAPMGEHARTVAAQLADADRLRKGRMHPVNVLVALRTYASGQSARGESSWQPVPQITDALDAAFYAAFAAVEPTGKRTMLALDVSGSMEAAISGLPLTCREASAALALVTAATEPNHMIVGFTSTADRSRYTYGGFYGTMGELRRSTALTPLKISPRQRLDDAISEVSRLPFGGTDCALPMLHAMKNGIAVDTFVIYTDNETWAGTPHAHQALEQYRQRMGIPARLAVVGMTATDFTIADPNDPGSLDVAGFDSAVPNLLSDFSAGRI